MANPKIQLRHDTAANWTSVNPVLLEGEVGIETDTKKQKIGDGSTSWNSLAYQIQDFISNIPVGLNLSIDSGILSAQAGHITSQTDILKTSSVISTADISTIPNGVTNGVILGETIQYQDVDLTSGVTYIYADADGTSLNTMTENSKGAWLIASSSQGTNSSSWAHYGLVFDTPLQAGQYKFSVSTGASYGFLYACSGEIGNFIIISTIVNNEQNPQDVEVNIGSPIDALVWVVGNYNGWSAPYGLEVQKYESAKVFKTYLCKDNNSYSLKLATDTSALSSFDDYAQIGQVEYDNTLLNPVATPTEDLKNTFVNAQLANKDLSNLSTTGNAKFQEPLVSGTNIKTVNNTSLLGSGDVAVQPTLVSGTNIKTVNNTSLLGRGNVAVQATLVSGTNIKTINNTSLLGSGRIDVLQNVAQGTNSLSVLGTEIACIYNPTDTIVLGNNIGINSNCSNAILLGSNSNGICIGGSIISDTFTVVSNSGYYKLLDMTTGLIPDDRLSSNIANTSLSNLSSTGQKVIDGQWVQSFIILMDSSGTKSGVQVDLSSYLPNDNYNYDVKFKLGGYDDDSSYYYHIETDIFDDGDTSTGNSDYLQLIGGVHSRNNINIFDLPVGTGRYIKVYGSGADVFQILALGYRRLGTNS